MTDERTEQSAGTAAGAPTAGVEVEDAHGVRPGTDLPEPYPDRPGDGTPARVEPVFGTTPNGGYPPPED